MVLSETRQMPQSIRTGRSQDSRVIRAPRGSVQETEAVVEREPASQASLVPLNDVPGCGDEPRLSGLGHVLPATPSHKKRLGYDVRRSVRAHMTSGVRLDPASLSRPSTP